MIMSPCRLLIFDGAIHTASEYTDLIPVGSSLVESNHYRTIKGGLLLKDIQRNRHQCAMKVCNIPLCPPIIGILLAVSHT